MEDQKGEANSDIAIPESSTCDQNTCEKKKIIDITKYLHRPGMTYDTDSDTSSISSLSNGPPSPLANENEESENVDLPVEEEALLIAKTVTIEPKEADPCSPKPVTRTKGELRLEDLPEIVPLDIEVPEEDLEEVGIVIGMVNQQVVIRSSKSSRALNLDSVLFLSGTKPLGRIFDVFGSVRHPYYTVRFNTDKEIEQARIEKHQPVFYAPDHEDITSFVLVEKLQREKGSDASWQNNNEPPVECLDYSDDEEERAARQRRRRANSQTPAEVSSDDRNYSSQRSTSQYSSSVRNTVPGHRPSSHVPLTSNYFQNVRNQRPVQQVPFSRRQLLTAPLQRRHHQRPALEQPPAGRNRRVFRFANPNNNTSREDTFAGPDEQQQYSLFSFCALPPPSPQPMMVPQQASNYLPRQPPSFLSPQSSHLLPQQSPNFVPQQFSSFMPQPSPNFLPRSNMPHNSMVIRDPSHLRPSPSSSPYAAQSPGNYLHIVPPPGSCLPSPLPPLNGTFMPMSPLPPLWVNTSSYPENTMQLSVNTMVPPPSPMQFSSSSSGYQDLGGRFQQMNNPAYPWNA